MKLTQQITETFNQFHKAERDREKEKEIKTELETNDSFLETAQFKD